MGKRREYYDGNTVIVSIVVITDDNFDKEKVAIAN